MGQEKGKRRHFKTKATICLSGSLSPKLFVHISHANVHSGVHSLPPASLHFENCPVKTTTRDFPWLFCHISCDVQHLFPYFYFTPKSFYWSAFAEFFEVDNGLNFSFIKLFFFDSFIGRSGSLFFFISFDSRLTKSFFIRIFFYDNQFEWINQKERNLVASFKIRSVWWPLMWYTRKGVEANINDRW
jgi:hypothetical protein